MLVMPDCGSVAAEQLSDATGLASEVYNDSDAAFARVPVVGVLLDESPHDIAPATFFEKLSKRVLDNTPVDFDETARALRTDALDSAP